MTATQHRMKLIHGFVAVCLAAVGLTACTTESVGSNDTRPTQQTVVRYSAEDIAALAPGEVLRIDVTVPNTSYVVSYVDPAILERVVVVDGKHRSVLADVLGATAAGDGTLKQVVISAEGTAGASAGQADLAIRCNDAGDFCCICNNGVCQCGPVVDA